MGYRYDVHHIYRDQYSSISVHLVIFYDLNNAKEYVEYLINRRFNTKINEWHETCNTDLLHVWTIEFFGEKYQIIQNIKEYI